ncbi:hypothetical protein CJU81_23610, partial [Pseudomonas fragi]
VIRSMPPLPPAPGWPGAVVSMVRLKGRVGALTPVAVVAVAVKLWLPSPRSGVVKFQLPRALAVAVPSGVVPS